MSIQKITTTINLAIISTIILQTIILEIIIIIMEICICPQVISNNMQQQNNKQIDLNTNLGRSQSFGLR